MGAPVLVGSHQIGWISALPICYIHLCFRKSPVPDILWSQRHNTLDMKGSQVIICHCNGQRILDSSDHNMARHSGGSVRSVGACGPVLPANGNKNNGAPEKYIIAWHCWLAQLRNLIFPNMIPGVKMNAHSRIDWPLYTIVSRQTRMQERHVVKRY